MLKRLKFLFFAAILTGLWTASCKKEPAPLVKAVITGEDNRACICFGGLMVNFTENAIPYAEPFFLVNSATQELRITNATTFPIYCLIDTIQLHKCNSNKFIQITKFERR